MQRLSDIKRVQQLFNIKKTQLEMVRDRGYDIGDEAQILQMSLENFIQYVTQITIQHKTSPRAALSRSYLTREDVPGPKRSMIVYYGGKTNPQQKQVPAEIVREFIALIQKYGVTEAILIVDAPLSSSGNLELTALVSVKWQIFDDTNLTYNPIKHVDVPLHELLSKEEADAKIREMKTSYSQVLIMSAKDPVARYYGWTPGSLIRIHRDDSAVSILSPKSVNYRYIHG